MLSYLVWLFSYFFLAVYIANSIRHILDVILIPKVIYKYIVVGLKKILKGANRGKNNQCHFEARLQNEAYMQGFNENFQGEAKK